MYLFLNTVTFVNDCHYAKDGSVLPEKKDKFNVVHVYICASA